MCIYITTILTLPLQPLLLPPLPLQEATFDLLERLISAEGELLTVLGGSNVNIPDDVYGENYSGDGSNRGGGGVDGSAVGHVIYNNISETSPDFLWFQDGLYGKCSVVVVWWCDL